MDKREISRNVYDKIINSIPIEIIKMLPDDPEKLLPYAKRVKNIKFSNGIDDETKKLMRDHLLSDEEYLKTFYYVMAITFYNKKAVLKPKMNIVVAQTGSGKSNLTAKILREDENCIFIDSDKYKHFRYDAKIIAENYKVLYPYLTGPDSYNHADNIYEYAIDNKYNIIKEVAPSEKEGLILEDIEKLQEIKYNIAVYILAVGELNSLLSIHERYELQIIHGLKTAKLTGIKRHDESYNALIKNVEEIRQHYDNFVYIRGNKNNRYEPIRIYPSKKYCDIVQAIESARKIDNDITKKEFESRYNLIIEQMKKRNAPIEQFEQINIIKERSERYE